MAEFTPSAATCSADASMGQICPQVSNHAAGEAINAGMPVYLDVATGKWMKATGAAADAKASIWGFAARTVKANQQLTAYGLGARFNGFGSGLTAGALLYVGATAGTLSDAATTGGTRPIARAISTTDIVVIGAY